LNNTQPSDHYYDDDDNNNDNNNKQFTIDAAAIVPPHNVAPSPAHSSYKTTNTTDVNSVAQHHYSYRPYLQHRQLK
jgi:hypothetical protein